MFICCIHVLYFIYVALRVQIRASDTNVAIQQLVRVSGIGPAFARKLVDQNITSIEGNS